MQNRGGVHSRLCRDAYRRSRPDRRPGRHRGQNNFKPQDLKIPGGDHILHTGNAAGLDYDPIAGCIVGWASWSPEKVYTLDLDARKWDVKETEGGPKVTSFAENGVFGRWRYVAGLNAFIAVSDAGGNVFFYKQTTGDGQTAKTK